MFTSKRRKIQILTDQNKKLRARIRELETMAQQFALSPCSGRVCRKLRNEPIE